MKFSSFLCVGFVTCPQPFQPEAITGVLNEEHWFDPQELDALLEHPLNPEDLNALLNEEHPFRPEDGLKPSDLNALLNEDWASIQRSLPVDTSHNFATSNWNQESEDFALINPNSPSVSDVDGNSQIPSLPNLDQGSQLSVPSVVRSSIDNRHEIGHSSDIAFVTRDIDFRRVRGGRIADFLKHVQEHLKAHVQECRLPPPRSLSWIYQQNSFIDLDSGALLDNVNASVVCLEHNQLAVRVKHAGLEKFVDLSRLLPVVRAVFSEFYNLVPEDEVNHAANWLWRVLTKHEESLPVIGFVKPGTAEADYKLGPIQRALIECISAHDWRRKASGVAFKAHQVYPCKSRSSTSVTPSSPRTQAMRAHLGKTRKRKITSMSFQYSDLVFVRGVGFSTDCIGQKADFLKHVRDHLVSHVASCRLHSAVAHRPVYKRNGFQDLNSGAPIDVNAYVVLSASQQLVVRVKEPKSEHFLDTARLQPPVRAVFSKFYDVVPLHELEDAANWLWRTLTRHEESLPVIGPIKAGTAEADYKFGPIQVALIQCISADDRGEEADEVAKMAAKEYASKGLSSSLVTSSNSPYQTVPAQLEESKKRRKIATPLPQNSTPRPTIPRPVFN